MSKLKKTKTKTKTKNKTKKNQKKPGLDSKNKSQFLFVYEICSIEHLV